MTTNDHLTELERDLESDLIAARHELEEAGREALGQVDSHRAELGKSADIAIAEVHALVSRAEADLVQVQRRLGEMNYILAEEKIDDLATFDRHRDRVLEALRAAHNDLDRLERERRGWSERDDSLSVAWKRLAERFDSVRGHLAGEVQLAEQGFAAERAHLEREIESVDADAKRGHADILTRLRAEFEQALPGIRAIFMYRGDDGR